jgi:hypothetical protein
VNAVLALVARDGGWFENLSQQGFRLHALELDVQSTPGVIRVDVLLYRTDPDVILLVENKSGRNVEERQARGYAAAELTGVRSRGGVPNELMGRPDVLVRPLYVCLEEHREDIVRSLAALEVETSILSVGAGRAQLDGPVPPGLTPFESVDARLGLPPVRIRVDAESPIEEFMAILVQCVVAADVRGEQHVDLVDVARGAFQGHWVHLSVQAQRELVGRFQKAAGQLSRGELRGLIRVEGSATVTARVAIVDSPALADPRGAPQRWQSLMRKAARDLGRDGPSIVERQAQMSIDDFAIDVAPAEDFEADLPIGDDRDTADDA